MPSISISELPKRGEFIGKPIKEHGVDVEQPLAQFHVNGKYLEIFVSKGDGNEESIGGGNTDYIHAEIAGDGNLYISGSYCPTFVLYLNN
jgi:hypothetical protein